MKTTGNLRLASCILGAVIALSAPAHSQSLAEVKKKGAVTIGVLVDFPPFGLLDKTGKPAGYDIDLAQLVARKLGVKAELKSVSGPNRVPYLLTNRVDMLIAALGITTERAQQVDFSQPSAAVEQMLYAPKDRKIAALSDLSGVSVGVARGSAQDITLTKSAPGTAAIKRFDDDPSTLQALLAGQVDAMVLSTQMMAQIGKVADTSKFEGKFAIQRIVHGIAIRKSNPDLLNRINEILSEIKASGELNEIHRKWLGIDFTNIDSPKP